MGQTESLIEFWRNKAYCKNTTASRNLDLRTFERDYYRRSLRFCLKILTVI